VEGSYRRKKARPGKVYCAQTELMVALTQPIK